VEQLEHLFISYRWKTLPVSLERMQIPSLLNSNELHLIDDPLSLTAKFVEQKSMHSFKLTPSNLMSSLLCNSKSEVLRKRGVCAGSHDAAFFVSAIWS
jgi:hypothetical protein